MPQGCVRHVRGMVERLVLETTEEPGALTRAGLLQLWRKRRLEAVCWDKLDPNLVTGEEW